MKIANISKEYGYFNALLAVVLFILAIAPLGISIPGVAISRSPTSWQPPACAVRQITGQGCAGDGLTRSVAVLYQGKLSLSLSYHPIGIFIVALVVIELLLRLLPWLIKSRWLPWIDLGQLVLASLSIKYFLST